MCIRDRAIAQAKQELIKQGFQDWVWSDPERRERLCILYNEKFNSRRPREYDGSHIVFSGMTVSYTHLDVYKRQAYTTEFGFRADTEKYAFVLRCNPTRGCLLYTSTL